MIPVEHLEKVERIVVHGYGDRACPDGVASALILRDVLPAAQVEFVTHGPALDGLLCTPRMLFCDLAPPAKRIAEFVDAGAIVLDHHRGSRELVAPFVVVGHGAFADEEKEPGVSGAVLAYREVWRRLAFRGTQRPPNHMVEGRGEDMVAHFAKVVGVRDTYQRKSPLWDLSRQVSAALAFWPFDRFPIDLFGEVCFYAPFQAMLDVGEVLVEKKDADVRSLWKRRFQLTITSDPIDLDVVIIPSRETTDAAELLSGTDGLLVGFDYEAGDNPYAMPVLSISLRSRVRKDESAGSGVLFDCATLAKQHGGGGHTGAAGFRFSPTSDPYVAIERLLRHYVEKPEGVFQKRSL